MKLQSNNTLLKNLNVQELKILTTEINESLCKNFKKQKRNFTVAELWNIHRRKGNRLTQRFSY